MWPSWPVPSYRYPVSPKPWHTRLVLKAALRSRSAPSAAVGAGRGPWRESPERWRARGNAAPDTGVPAGAAFYKPGRREVCDARAARAGRGAASGAPTAVEEAGANASALAVLS